MKKSYLICHTEDSSFYIPQASHIERNDELMLVYTDEEASIDAKKEGVLLIEEMDGVPDNVYIDSLKNREIIKQMLIKYPEYYIQ